METRVLIPNVLKVQKVFLKSPSHVDAEDGDDDTDDKLSSTTRSTRRGNRKESRNDDEPTSSSSPTIKIKPMSSSSEDDEVETDVILQEESDDDDGLSSAADKHKDVDSSSGSGYLRRRRRIKRKPSENKSCRRIAEFHYGICSKDGLRAGAKFRANEGDIQILIVEDKHLSPLDPNDKRLNFGCFERLTFDEDKKQEQQEGHDDDDDEEDDNPNPIRLCNWIRFLRTSTSSHNVIGRVGHDDDNVEFEILQNIPKGGELVVKFDAEGNRHNNNNDYDFLHPWIKREKGDDGVEIDGPLDLSKSPGFLIQRKPNQLRSTIPIKMEDEKLKTGAGVGIDKNLSSNTNNTTIKDKGGSLFSISSVLNLKQGSNHFKGGNGDIMEKFLRNQNGVMKVGVGGTSGTGDMTMTTHHHHHRPILRTRGRERSLLPCEVCGKAFDRPSLLKRHMRTHTGEKPHVCDVCSKGFSTSSSLNTHRRIHSGEKPHQCSQCGKRFTASSNLYYHRMTHNKEKPHKCLLCGKSFPTPGDLKSHQYVHSGSWPFNCPICHRGFSKQTNLRNHLLLHSGDKPHNCHICNKKFALACNLRAHLRTHEEEPISSCLSCKRSFLSSLNMLVNGHCRSCLLSLNVVSLGSSSSITKGQGQDQGGSQVHHHHQGSKTQSTSPSVTPPSHSLLRLPNHVPLFPHGAVSGWSGLGVDMSTGNTPPSRNPFLEQLFQWNYRFAKETAGNLSIMQQKLLESQMLAAQLMIGSSPAAGGGGGNGPTAQTNTSTIPTNPLYGVMGLPNVSDLIRSSVSSANNNSHHINIQDYERFLDLNKFVRQ